MTCGTMVVSILLRVFKLFKLVNPESCSRVESKDKRTLPYTEKGIGEMREPGDEGKDSKKTCTKNYPEFS